MASTEKTTACGAGTACSDSVNLGSNPSSPATQNIEVSGKTAPGHSGHPGQTAHIGRTEVGTGDDRANPGHTPGPWAAVPNTERCGYGPFEVSKTLVQSRPDADGLYVACVLTDIPPDQHEANARLIAAAPEMLQGLHAILSDLRHLEQYGPGSVDLSGYYLVGIPALITKATGATP
jgi:hypothetical protein